MLPSFNALAHAASSRWVGCMDECGQREGRWRGVGMAWVHRPQIEVNEQDRASPCT